MTEEFTPENVLKAVVEYGNYNKGELIELARQSEGEEPTPISEWRQWTRGQLLAFVIEHHPYWEDEDTESS